MSFPSSSYCTVTGNVANILGQGVQNCVIRCSVISPYIYQGAVVNGEIEQITTDASGNFSITLLETESVGQRISFQFNYSDGISNRKIKTYSVVVPSTPSASFTDIVGTNTPPVQNTTFPALGVAITAISGLAATNAQAAFSEIITDLAAKQPSGAFVTALTGDVSATGPGSSAATVNSVGGASAAAVAAAATANATATDQDTPSTLVKRDSSGNFSAGTITADLVGDASGTAANITATSNSTLTTLSSLSLPGSQVTGNISGNAGNVTGTVAIANGGTGQATQAAALTALAGTQASGKYLRSDGTNTSLAAIQSADVPTLNQNTTGTAANVTGTVAIANGGTGQTSATPSFNALSPLTTKGDLLAFDGTNNVRFAAGSSGQVPIVDSTQTSGIRWTTLQQGTKNYIADNNFENNSTAGWSLFNTTLTGVIPTGTVGSGASSLNALSVISSAPLAGLYSLSVSSPGAVTAGQGFISQAYTLDKEDQAKMLSFKFYYEAVSGTMNFSGSSSNTWAVYLWDTANSAWVQPAGVYNLVQGSGVGICTGEFQTASNATSYQLAVVCVNATGGAVTVYFDDFSLGPQTSPMGPAMTDWNTNLSFTPVSFGTVTNNTWYTKRVGDSLHVRGYFTTGTTAAATASLTLPAGLSIDFSKLLSGYGNAGFVGIVQAQLSSAAGIFVNGNVSALFTDGSTPGSLFFSYQTSAGAYVKENGSSTQGNSLGLSFQEFSIPIVGWSSNTSVSNDTDTRVCAASYYASASTSANGVINFDSKFFDTHGAVTTGSSWKFTAPVSGIYRCSAAAALTSSGTACDLSLYKNGTLYKYLAAWTTSDGTIYKTGATLIQLSAGDYIDVRGDTSVSVNGNGTGTLSSVSIERLTGPAVIAATESVNASYFASTSHSANGVLNFDTKNYDSHSAVTTGSSWKFTAPVSGVYRCAAAVALTSNGTATDLALYKNGSMYKYIAGWTSSDGTTYKTGSTSIKLSAGDYVDFRGDTSTSINGDSGGTLSSMSIERIGN